MPKEPLGQDNEKLQASTLVPRALNTTLQNRVLLALENSQVKSVTALAQQLEANRASVSRAINALNSATLVCKEAKVWALTESGHAEIAKIKEQVEARVTRAATAALRATSPLVEVAAFRAGITEESKRQREETLQSLQRATETTNKMFKATFPSGVGPHLREIERASSLVAGMTISHQNLQRQVAEAISATQFRPPNFIAEAIRFSGVSTGYADVDRDVFKTLNMPHHQLYQDSVSVALAKQCQTILDTQNKSMQSFLSSQSVGVNALAELHKSISVFRVSEVSAKELSANLLLSQQFSFINQSLSRIIDDIGTIRSHTMMADSPVYEARSWLRETQRVALRYDGYLRQAARSVPIWDQLSLRDQTVLDARLPTFVTEQYVAIVRDTVVPEDEREERAPIQEVIIVRLETWRELDDALGKVAPRLVKMWHGAWEVLDTSGSDKLRQSAHSAREVLAQFLHICAPDSAFSTEEIQVAPNRRPTRKMRFRKMLGSKSAADWATAVADNMDQMYNRLSGVSHDHDEELGGSMQEVLGLLEMTQGLMRYILGVRNS